MERASETLANKGKGFVVPVESICVLHRPSQFYEALCQMSREANDRVVWSSLYLGTDIPEQKLCSDLVDNLKNNSSLKVLLLMDKYRACRKTKDKSPNSAEFFASNVLKYAKKGKCALFELPTLSSVESYILRGKWREIAGVQHMKFYIFDDQVIISGANLSKIYFEKRQDRYVIVRSKELADHLHNLAESVFSMSHSVNEKGLLSYPKNVPHPEFNAREFREHFRQSIDLFCQPDALFPKISDDQALIYPALQMGSAGIFQDSSIVHEMIELCSHEENIHLASGYLNIPIRFVEALKESMAKVTVIKASANASGFHKGKGLSGLVPSFYEGLMEEFTSSIENHDKISIQEYDREGWSYHQKGLWITNPSNDSFATIIGSSNFGYRSMFRDLECNFAILSRSKQLHSAFDTERSNIFAYLKPIGEQKSKSILLRRLAVFLKHYF